MSKTLPTPFLKAVSGGCARADVASWSENGGPLPRKLAEHVLTCESCAEQVRRFNEVNLTLRMMSSQPSPPELLARANGRALRFLRRAARASETAKRLLVMRPNLTVYQRAYIHCARASMGLAAAILVLIMRTGVTRGIAQTTQLGEELAQYHWKHHIDPTGEWMGPRTTM